ncbi:2-oxo-4-hydroxy-4-carboxy-5-ureidoimidazoline decarboxylase [Nocardiopsis sp. JB363]|uniref:2-oxo-4-hydroxy-4-carboxy-5-ureidoimidazoline decarboxylase n=1 Tax=Nocardiopsis sp. JB363 TaxID=1434837 RepID=UPI00097AF15B|nr:2-oxo-4-hydroxy-4-carboxy-5-ureidoimidazoline decarboxylase [Nocardiopsis sp. JB363]SIO91106.1 2-oxo-4-hydroxy-4-carboxy--5-ureidoimidazoline (OHCU) decarboxylase [Nocardiopsis sp. JB363]
MPETTPDTSGAAPEPGLAHLNRLSKEDLRTELAQCLDIDRWVEAVAAEAPFTDRTTLLAHADEHARAITSAEVATALARHPRIGEKASGENTEAAWSRGEQSAFAADIDDASTRVQRIFTHAQGEYEGRFGQIYLVCASGRSSRELLMDLVTRLDNDPESELVVVGDELRKIAGLRLVKLLEAA